MLGVLVPSIGLLHSVPRLSDRGVQMRKQAKLMEFGLNYQRFADYQR